MSPEQRPRFQRRNKLPKPRLQLRLVGYFLGASGLSLLLQYLLFAHRVSETAARLPSGGEYLMDALPSLLFEVLGLSFLVLLPATALVGILVTFRVAGPVFRFERFLEGVARGEEVQPCRLRRGDELGELCDRINLATQPLRRENAERGADEPGDPYAVEGPVAGPAAAVRQ